jgi:hypothetical protein
MQIKRQTKLENIWFLQYVSKLSRPNGHGRNTGEKRVRNSSHLGCEHKNQKWRIKVSLSLVEGWSGWESNSLLDYNVLYTLKILVSWNNLILVTSLIIALGNHDANERSDIAVAALFNPTLLDPMPRHTTYNIFHRPQISCLISAGITGFDWRWMYRTSENMLQT